MGNPQSRTHRRWTGPKHSVTVKGDGRRQTQAKSTPTPQDAADLARKEVNKLLRDRTAVKAAHLLIDQFTKHPARPGMRRLKVAKHEADKLVPTWFTPTEQAQTSAINAGMYVAMQQLALAGDTLHGRNPERRKRRRD